MRKITLIIFFSLGFSLPLFGDDVDVFLSDLANQRIPVVPLANGKKVRYCLPLSFERFITSYKTDQLSAITRLKKYCLDRPEHEIVIRLVAEFSEFELLREESGYLDIYWFSVALSKLEE